MRLPSCDASLEKYFILRKKYARKSIPASNNSWKSDLADASQCIRDDFGRRARDQCRASQNRLRATKGMLPDVH
jgi:hypothetical protein